MHTKKTPPTSWGAMSQWYDQKVGSQGHYYHQEVIIPKSLSLLKRNGPIESLVDLGCGQGVFARHIPPNIPYLGMDIASPLLEAAQTYQSLKHHRFVCADLTAAQLPFTPEPTFSHAISLLAIQNMSDGEQMLQHAQSLLLPDGVLLLVLNHPCFRIPRQSSWGVDPQQKLQYRRIDRYMTPLAIPITTHPGQKETSSESISFHSPLSLYSKWLSNKHFVILEMEEWCSNKASYGKAAKHENRSREEFPLFLAILAQKRGSK